MSTAPGMQRRLFLCFLTYINFRLSTALPASPIVGIDPLSGNVTFEDPDTGIDIPQFPATDGGAGVLNKVLWIIFAALVGLPLGVAGVRLGRLSTGAAMGLTAAFVVWVAFVNALPMPFNTSSASASDLILTIIIIATFLVFSFLGAFLHSLYPYGLALLGGCGGASLFMRVVIIRAGLLISQIYAINIVLIVIGAVMGIFAILWKRRLGVIACTGLVATFLVALGLDVALNFKSAPGRGMSDGLRLLLDRNSSHAADLFQHKYVPTITTQAIIGGSLGLVPLIGFIQHRFFPGPFHFHLRPTRDSLSGDSDILGESAFKPNMGVGASRFSRAILSRFSLG